MTREQKEILEVIASAVKDKIKQSVAPLERRIAALEQNAKEFRYLGVWAVGLYRKGNFVTHQGSVWHCEVDTHSKPGEDPRAWTLAVKRGKHAA